jgi:hypothetical protein
VKLSDKQAAIIARTITEDIRAYVDTNAEAYELFLLAGNFDVHQRKASQYQGKETAMVIKPRNSPSLTQTVKDMQKKGKRYEIAN